MVSTTFIQQATAIFDEYMVKQSVKDASIQLQILVQNMCGFKPTIKANDKLKDIDLDFDKDALVKQSKRSVVSFNEKTQTLENTKGFEITFSIPFKLLGQFSPAIMGERLVQLSVALVEMVRGGREVVNALQVASTKTSFSLGKARDYISSMHDSDNNLRTKHGLSKNLSITHVLKKLGMVLVYVAVAFYSLIIAMGNIKTVFFLMAAGGPVNLLLAVGYFAALALMNVVLFLTAAWQTLTSIEYVEEALLAFNDIVTKIDVNAAKEKVKMLDFTDSFNALEIMKSQFGLEGIECTV